jgi:hypothetical protein
MGSRSLRSRELVRCVRCGSMVARATAQQGSDGWVGGSCLKNELAAARNASPNTSNN